MDRPDDRATKIRSFYEGKVDDYPEVDRPAQVRCAKAIQIARISKGMRVLDIACKDGVLLGELDRAGLEVDYVGIDISERVIERTRARGLRGELLVANVLEGTPFPDRSFDRVFALEIMEHLPEPARLLEEAQRLLTGEGRLILSVPNPYYYMDIVNEIRRFPESDGHLFSFTDANLRAFLALHGFMVEDMIGTFFLIPKTLRSPFETTRVWVLDRVPKLLARSRVYRCRRIT